MSVEKVKPIETIGNISFSTEADNGENKGSFKDTIKQIEEDRNKEEKVEQQLKSKRYSNNIQEIQQEMVLNNQGKIYSLMCKLETVGEVGAIKYIEGLIKETKTKDEER